MPAIAGLITPRGAQPATAELSRMVQSLCHEPSSRTRTWCDESAGVYVGWAAREGAVDRLPIRNGRQDVVLIFSGEEFSQPNGPLRLYEEDASFPARLNGRFHGIVIDHARGTATVFNDRYGMRRLYLYESKDTVYFASEAKAILAVRSELRRLDPRSLTEFIACGCVLDNRTLFRGIQLLPAGSARVFRAGSMQKNVAYFRPSEWENQPALSPEAYYQELRSSFTRSLPRYFGGPRPIGIALTGGLDTRMIMAWRDPRPSSLPCYTFGGTLRDSQDVRIARKVAEACGQSHQVIRVGREFFARFGYYAERSVYLTDGCVDVSRAPDLYVSRHAREIAPVKIVGTYGSEILTRVPTFEPVMPTHGVFSRDLFPYFEEAVETYGGMRREHPVTFAAFRQAPWSHYGVVALEETELVVRCPYLDDDFVRAAFRAPTAPRATADVRLRLIREGNPMLGGIRTDRGVGGSTGPLRRRLTRALLGCTFKAEHFYDDGMPQWLAATDHLLSPFRPERVLFGRHKPYHFRVWYQTVLGQYVRDVLLDRRSQSRSYLERGALDMVVRRHLDGSRNYTVDLHRLLTLELMHRLFLDA